MNGFLVEYRINGNRSVSASNRKVFPINGIIGNNIGDFVSFHGNKYNILMEKHDDGDNILMILG